MDLWEGLSKILKKYVLFGRLGCIKLRLPIPGCAHLERSFGFNDLYKRLTGKWPCPASTRVVGTNK